MQGKDEVLYLYTGIRAIVATSGTVLTAMRADAAIVSVGQPAPLLMALVSERRRARRVGKRRGSSGRERSLSTIH